MLNDLIKSDLAPGECLLVWDNLQCGMIVINTLPTSAQGVSKTQREEKDYGDTKHTHNYDEAEKGSKKDPCKPVGTYDKLRKNVTTYAVSILALFGTRTNTIREYKLSTE